MQPVCIGVPTCSNCCSRCLCLCAVAAAACAVKAASETGDDEKGPPLQFLGHRLYALRSPGPPERLRLAPPSAGAGETGP